MIRVSDHASLSAVCDRLGAMRAPHLPLFAAVAAKRIAVVSFLNPAGAWNEAAFKRLTRPVVVLIVDDPDIGEGVALGPDQWPLARRLAYWARMVIVHGAEGEAQHYRAAVEAAERYRRVALVETSAAMAMAWGAFLRHPRTLMILPCDGQHPVAKGTRH